MDGQPVPKQSFRFVRGRRSFQPAKVRAWEEAIGWAAKQAMTGIDLIEGQLRIEIQFDRARTPGRPADLGNLEKPVCDALNGVVYRDDSQIVEMLLVRNDLSENPGVSVLVEEI